MISTGLAFLLPETRRRSLESMDVLFGAVSQSQRDADIARIAAGGKDEHDHAHDAEGEDEKETQDRIEKV